MKNLTRRSNKTAETDYENQQRSHTLLSNKMISNSKTTLSWKCVMLLPDRMNSKINVHS